MKSKYLIEIGYYHFFAELAPTEVATLSSVFSRTVEVDDRRYAKMGLVARLEEEHRASFSISTLPKSTVVSEQLRLVEKTEEAHS